MPSGVSLPENRPVAGGCSSPIRLSGYTDQVDRETGRVRRVFSSVGQPGNVVHVRCNNRRESVCPACSQTYKRDARRLVLTGLAGGGGLPVTVGGHPALFVTLTAPTFGAVHSRRSAGKGGEARACRPRRGLCPHGRPAGCHARHGDGDRQLGTPLCADCFDYAGAVVWNAMLPMLWKVTRDRLEVAIAAAAGLSVARMRRELRVTFVKAAEMQARGLVHLHVVIRLDGRGTAPGDVEAPPGWASVELVADCLRQVLACVTVDAPDPTDPAGVTEMRWGAQHDLRPVAVDGADTTGKIANYLAKYLTKSVTGSGLLDRPVRSRAHLERLPLEGHARRMVEACWTLGGDARFAAALDVAAGRAPGKVPGLLRWSHMFGFGGHWITKSRRYSTTFGALRDARRVYARTVAAALSGGLPVDAFGRADGDPRTVVVRSWGYVGRGTASGGARPDVSTSTDPARDGDGGEVGP